MSIQVNQTASPYKGLVQFYEKEIGVDRGHVSGNSDRLAEFISDANIAMDIYTNLAHQAAGRWPFHDHNHSGDNIFKLNLVSGTQEYTIDQDETDSANILDIVRVAILRSASATNYHEIDPVSEEYDEQTHGLLSEDSTQGVPRFYTKYGNKIKVTPIPDYNATNGLKVYVNLEPHYFTTSDTTETPGVRGTHHAYFYLRPAYDHARRHQLAVLPRLEAEILKWEGDESRGLKGIIEKDYARRRRDEPDILDPEPIDYE